jgi:hypothetical protein
MALIASSETLGGVVGQIVSGSTLSGAGGHEAVLVTIGLMAAYAATLVIAHLAGTARA